MDLNRWDVTDAFGATHTVSVHKGVLGTPSLRVDGRQVMQLGGEGIVAFEIAGRQARLSPQPGGTGYDFSVGSIAQPAPAPVGGVTVPIVDATTTKLVQQRDRAANWFYWIAGLSLVNTVLLVVGSDYSFASGLGIATYIAVVVYLVAGEQMLWVSIFATLPLVAGLFFLGRRAHSGATWPFVLGLIVYALDLLLVLTLTDWIGVAIHGFALFSFVGGWRAARALGNVRRAEAAAAA
jgi:hypothetical protein